MTSKLSASIVSLWLIALLAGCAYSSGFSFPMEQGDVDAGRQAFIDHQCHQCHRVAGVALPALAGAGPALHELGGETSAAKGYGELFSSIIDPNHAISEAYRKKRRLEGAMPLDSPMPLPQIDNMTVRQLIDIVVFLDSRYMYVENYGSGN